MTFDLNVQFSGTLMVERPKSILVLPSEAPQVRDEWWPCVWLPKMGVIKFNLLEGQPEWRIPMAPYWFTVHRWIASTKGLRDGRPESERV